MRNLWGHIINTGNIDSYSPIQNAVLNSTLKSLLSRSFMGTASFQASTFRGSGVRSN